MRTRRRSWISGTALVALLASPSGCGTRVLELEGGPDAGADAGTATCVTEKGPLGEPCTMCYFADGRPIGGTCTRPVPPGVPPCAANTSPLADECARCGVFAYPGKPGIETCLVCKGWEKTGAAACRTCSWTNVPLEATCQQCVDANGFATETCDQVLQKVQTVY